MLCFLVRMAGNLTQMITFSTILRMHQACMPGLRTYVLFIYCCIAQGDMDVLVEVLLLFSLLWQFATAHTDYVPLLLVRFAVPVRFLTRIHPWCFSLRVWFCAARGGRVHRDLAQPQGSPGERRGVDELRQVGRGKCRGEGGIKFTLEYIP